MNKREKSQLYHKAFAKWGIDAQTVVLMEECAELIQVASKLYRNDIWSPQLADHLAEEIADVEIMIEQFKVFDFGELAKKVERVKAEKLKRLAEVLQNG